MSGGKFNYEDSALRNEIFGYDDTWHDVFEDREISELVWDVLQVIHDFDWYASGDTDEGRYLEAKRYFKEKWLKGNPKERTKRVIDETIEEARQQLYKTYGI